MKVDFDVYFGDKWYEINVDSGSSHTGYNLLKPSNWLYLACELVCSPLGDRLTYVQKQKICDCLDCIRRQFEKVCL